MRNLEKCKFFDILACEWDKLFYSDYEILERIDKLIASFDIKKDSMVLDLGCGTGITSERISRLIKNAKVLCCDFSFSMLKIAKERRGKNLSFICANAENLPFKNEVLDYLICFSCFPHFDNKNKMLEEAVRVLRKGGLLIISHFLSSKEIEEVHRTKAPVSDDKMPSRSWMITNLREIGFKILEFVDRKGLYLIRAEKL